MRFVQSDDRLRYPPEQSLPLIVIDDEVRLNPS